MPCKLLHGRKLPAQVLIHLLICIPALASSSGTAPSTLQSAASPSASHLPRPTSWAPAPLPPPTTRPLHRSPAAAAAEAPASAAAPGASADASAPSSRSCLATPSGRGDAADFASFAAVARSPEAPNIIPLVQRLFSDQLTPVLAYRSLVKVRRCSPLALQHVTVGPPCATFARGDGHHCPGCCSSPHESHTWILAY